MRTIYKLARRVAVALGWREPVWTIPAVVRAFTTQRNVRMMSTRSLIGF